MRGLIFQATGLSLLTGLAMLAACSRPEPFGRPTELTLGPCDVSGLGVEARCGTLQVLENREATGGRRIGLRVAVIPAISPTPEPDPLFLLAGGPGQSIVEAAEGALPSFERIRRKRALVLVDQRGTGGSNPLSCEVVSADAGLSERLNATLDPRAFAACAETLKSRADPVHYTTAAAVEDLDQVRAALGYRTINLWGASYGTRLALEYLRSHAARVRAIALDGIAPPTQRLPLTFAADAQRALELTLRQCESSTECAGAFPQLRQRFESQLRALRRAPLVTQVADPTSGTSERLALSADRWTTALRAMLYLPETANLLPMVLARASEGDFAPFAALSEKLSSGFGKGLGLGLFLSVTCAEDAAGLEVADIDKAAEGTFVGSVLGKEILDACRVWPHGTAAPQSRTAVHSDVPALLLSGELDPVTPPSRGEETAATLSRSRHVVVPGIGHGATGQGCVPSRLAEFFDSGDPQPLDFTCLKSLERPPFFLSFAGPSP